MAVLGGGGVNGGLVLGGASVCYNSENTIKKKVFASKSLCLSTIIRLTSMTITIINDTLVSGYVLLYNFISSKEFRN